MEGEGIPESRITIVFNAGKDRFYSSEHCFMTKM